MKKVTAAVSVLLILISLCSCNSGEKTVLTVGGAKIDEEIFVYYLNKVVERPMDYGLADASDADSVKAAATEKCKRYVVVNTDFSEEGLSLSSAEKAEVAEKVNNLWVRFENHYNSIGVSKQTLTKIMTSEACEEALFTARYDKGTQDKDAEKEIENYFYSEYICFRTVCAYFTSGTESKMTQQEINDTVNSFNVLAKRFDKNTEAFSSEVTAAGYTLSDTILIKKDSDGYPAGFFERVAAQAENTVEVLVYDECVFAVLKEDLAEKGESIYANYRSSCIKELYSEEAEKLAAKAVETLTVEEKGKRADRLVKKYS